MTQEEKWELESYIDEHGLTAILSALKELCYEKATHVVEARGDKDLAKAHEHNAWVLSNMSALITDL